MIYIRMGGRLGNQFFQYAFARTLKKHNPQEQIIYNFDDIYRQHRTDGDGHENSLRYFHTVGTEHQDAINYSVLQYIVWKIYNRFYPRGVSFEQRDKYERRWLWIMTFFGMYLLSLGYYPFRLRKPWWVKNLIVKCSCESELFFQGVEDELKQAFVPKQTSLKDNADFMTKIQQTNAVAVCVRRGDFVDDKQTKDVYFVCDVPYYRMAIEKIKQSVDSPTFFFFSNDIEWTKQNLNVEGFPCYYEATGNPVWETVRLMSSCKHFIISNSTLHWWAQYLSPNSNKVVVAPGRWYRNNFKSALFQPNWELIDVEI